MKNKKGFTLVELLAVIAILAILVIIALPNVINLFNNAKRNAFETQVRKVAQVSKQKLFASGNNTKTFDCNSLLSGNSFEDCTASIEGSTVVIDALGSGQYSNYLMVDVTDDGESGTLIDLNKLKEIKVEDESLDETLVKNSKINEPLFKMLTSDEYIDLAIKISSKTPSDTEKEEAKAKYNDMISKITYNNNMISNNTNDSLFYLFKINFTDNMLGKYKIVWYNVGDFAANDDMINNKSIDPEKIFEDLNFNKDEEKIEATINVTKAQNYYFISVIDSGKENLGFEIEKIENENVLKLIGEKNITIESKQVKDYKDAGIMNNGKKLNSDEYFAYTRLKDAKGTYKYNYIVKTNKGIKKITRNIKIAGETDSRCFAFNNGAIEHYYYFVDNDSTKEKCPMDVIIPKQINGQNVIAIDTFAFTIGCNNNIVVPTYSKNKYEIKPMLCAMEGMGIKSVELPDTLEIVESGAFYGNNLKSLVIPKSVTRIEEAAFANNKLQSVTFEGDVNNIRIYCSAFSGEEHSNEVNSIIGECK